MISFMAPKSPESIAPWNSLATCSSASLFSSAIAFGSSSTTSGETTVSSTTSVLSMACFISPQTWSQIVFSTRVSLIVSCHRLFSSRLLNSSTVIPVLALSSKNLFSRSRYSESSTFSQVFHIAKPPSAFGDKDLALSSLTQEPLSVSNSWTAATGHWLCSVISSCVGVGTSGTLAWKPSYVPVSRTCLAWSAVISSCLMLFFVTKPLNLSRCSLVVAIVYIFTFIEVRKSVFTQGISGISYSFSHGLKYHCIFALNSHCLLYFFLSILYKCVIIYKFV